LPDARLARASESDGLAEGKHSAELDYQVEQTVARLQDMD
jgi:hypothetical protein